MNNNYQNNLGIDIDNYSDICQFIEDKENLNLDIFTDQIYDDYCVLSKTKPKDQLLAVWKDQKFKIFLQSYIKENYSKENVEIKDDFAAKVYVKMYEDHFKNNNSFYNYNKVMLHPDVTKEDYYFCLNKFQKFPKYYAQNQFILFSGLLYTFYMTDFGRKRMRYNTKLTMAIFGIPPLVVLALSFKICHYSLEIQVNQAGFKEKYRLK